MDAGNGRLEFVTRHGREEVEPGLPRGLLDGFQPGGTRSVGVLLRAKKGDDGGQGAALPADGFLRPLPDVGPQRLGAAGRENQDVRVDGLARGHFAPVHIGQEIE